MYTAASLFTKGGSEIGGISHSLCVYRSEGRCVCVCFLYRKNCSMQPLLDDFKLSVAVIDASGLFWTVSSRV